MRKKLKGMIDFLIPCYAYVPILLVIAFNCIAYFFTKPFLLNAEYYDLSIWIDERIPFVPFFVLFYILAYLQWGWNYLFHSRQSREFCYHLVTSDLIAKVICMAFFLAMPTCMARPEVVGDGIWEQLTRIIYSADTPALNLFPSIHCLGSWIAFRAALQMKNMPRWYAPAQLVLSILVFASTVMIKQHFFVDIFAGIAVVEIGWFLSKRFRLWRILEKIELPFVRRACTNIQKDG